MEHQAKILVEVKYLTSEKDSLQSLREHCVSFGSESVIDNYYDTPKFDFALRNHFLRLRDKQYVLKIGSQDFDPLFPAFTEFVSSNQIAHLLGIGKVGERYIAQGERDLSSFNMFPILNISCNRELFSLLWVDDVPTDLRLSSVQFGAIRVSFETQKFEQPRVRLKLFVTNVDQKDAARKFLVASAKHLKLLQPADHHGKFHRTLKIMHPKLHRKLVKKGLLIP